MGEPIHPTQETCFKGIPVSPGVVSAPLVVIGQEEIQVPNRKITATQIPEEIARLETALFQTREQIIEIQNHLSNSMGAKDANIFDAHLLVVEDDSLLQAVKRQLGTKLRCVEYVYHHLMMTYVRSMREIDDPYLQERAADLIDVGRRVLNNLMGRKVSDAYQLERPSIIVAHDISPSDTALLDRALVLGFATDVGSSTSHSAIMARSLNIPAVLGLRNAANILKSGTEVLLDGYQGILIVNPTEQTKADYGKITRQHEEIDQKLTQLRETRGATQDNHRIILCANVELPEDLEMLKEAGAEGIGLYRTEFLFLNRMDMPSEEEQMVAYHQVIQSAGEEGIIIRTIDLGGDKMPDHLDMDEEPNPFLGWRAIRYCLKEPEVFKTQLRAICRAAHGHKTSIMFPMIATQSELLQALALLEEAKNELRAKNLQYSDKLQVGAMIEIPSAALLAEQLIPHVDFFSIGTNDLIGYTLAVDRTNEKVAYLYQPTHPAVLRLIQNVVNIAHAHNKWVGVCGEMAGDVRLTPLLVGLGIDELSMGSIAIPRIKKAIQSLSYAEMRKVTEDLLKSATAEQIAAKLEEIAMAHYPELLI